MVAATLMNIECVRLASGASLLQSLEVAGKSREATLAVVEPGGIFLGSLNSALLLTELTGSGWHCGHCSITGSLEGFAAVGFRSLVDTNSPRVGPEAPAVDIAKQLLLLSSGGFVAVVDNSGVLLGTITVPDFIKGLLDFSNLK